MIDAMRVKIVCNDTYLKKMQSRLTECCEMVSKMVIFE